jgi:putative NADH-flavin reductase
VSKIVIFGAGGRAGRHAVAEAVARGHQVTAVVRDPGRYPDLTGGGVTLVAGDVTRPGDVAAAAAGHDAAVGAVYQDRIPPEEFYVGAARALLDGMTVASVGRLVVVGIGTMLRTGEGTALYDTPGFPEEARRLSLGHVAGAGVLQAGPAGIDWLVVMPPPIVLDNDASRTGRYRITGSQVLPGDREGASFSYADLAVAVIDEIETPRHHRMLVAVGPAPAGA